MKVSVKLDQFWSNDNVTWSVFSTSIMVQVYTIVLVHMSFCLLA